MNMAKCILLAEDDESLGYILSEYLSMHGYKVLLAKDGLQALKIFNKEVFDLCILDIMMPNLDGFSVATTIREQDKNIPIIFLTAKHLKIDKLKAFKMGADDYITKPVDEEVLIARIEAILRRSHRDIRLNDSEIFYVGNSEFNATNQTLRSNGNVKQLTSKEADIFHDLCKNKGQLVLRQRILKKHWGHNDYFSRKSMDVFIYKLRKYLEIDDTLSIDNVHGKGFILNIKE